MPISHLTELYRRADNKTYKGSSLQGDIPFSDRAVTLIKALGNYKELRFEEIEVDGQDVCLDSYSPRFPDSGTIIHFNIKCPESSANRFYHTIPNMLEKCRASISKGNLPEQFYIVESNYSFEDKDKTIPEMVILEKICRFIRQLSFIAHYHDSKGAQDYHKLVFLQGGRDASSSSLIIETRVDESLLLIQEFPDTTVLDELASKEAKENDLHYLEKKNLFYTSLFEFIKTLPVEKKDYFPTLLKNWKKFSDLYQNNLETYLSGFAFHKAKKEVAQAELKLAEDYSKVLTDITGKLLSIPLSMAIVISIAKTDTPHSVKMLLFLCLLLTGGIVTMSIINQKAQLKRIKNAKQLIFSAFKGKEEFYPDDLKQHIINMKTALNNNEKRLGIILNVYLLGCWAPTIIDYYIIINYH